MWLNSDAPRDDPADCRAMLAVCCRSAMARLNSTTWTEPAFFAWVIEQGLVERAEAYRAFNMGLGLVAVLRDGVAVPEGAILVGELVNRQCEPCQIDG